MKRGNSIPSGNISATVLIGNQHEVLVDHSDTHLESVFRGMKSDSLM